MEKTRFQSKPYRRSRELVIAEAAVEYFISICVTTTFLTAILDSMEVAASLQGIIGAIASLACSAQLIAVFGVKKTYPCKRWVSILNLVNQLLFGLLYCVPFVEVSKDVKIAAFIVMLLLAYACQHYLTPSRVNWQMALVEDNKRGIFTANKEIVSLIGGMIFSRCAGLLLDSMREKGEMQLCFIIFAVTITILAFLHFLILLFTKEPEPDTVAPPKRFGEILRTVFGNRNLCKVIFFDAMFEISIVSIHFYSVYLTQTLHFSYGYITTIAILHACFRAVVSRFLGRFADKHSWVSLMRLCMIVLSAGFVIFTFCVPENGLYMYPLFSLCYAFSLGGTNSGRVNLCLDYVNHEDRRYILGIKSSISGIIGFVSTLLASALVEHVAQNGNRLFGLSVYPQQILFAVSAVMLILLAFVFLPFLKKPNADLQNPDSYSNR